MWLVINGDIRTLQVGKKYELISKVEDEALEERIRKIPALEYKRLEKCLERLDNSRERIKELESKNHNAYLAGRSKGFEDGKRIAEELELLMQRAYQFIPKGIALQREFEKALKGK